VVHGKKNEIHPVYIEELADDNKHQLAFTGGRYDIFFGSNS